MAEDRHALLPGRLPTGILVLLLVAAALDATCFLPHPVSAPPGAPPPPPLGSLGGGAAAAAVGTVEAGTKGAATLPLVGLPSAKVRQNYHTRLKAWHERAVAYRGNLTLAEKELGPSMRSELGTAAALGAEPLSPACLLAAASVRERASARVEARLQGAAGLHALLVLRDLWVYGSLDPFTFEGMKAQKSKKLQKKEGVVPTEEKVCLALVGSSTTANAEWDKAAEEMPQSYGHDVATMYAVPLVVLPLIAYVLQLLQAFLSSKRPACASPTVKTNKD